MACRRNDFGRSDEWSKSICAGGVVEARPRTKGAIPLERRLLDWAWTTTWACVTFSCGARLSWNLRNTGPMLWGGTRVDRLCGSARRPQSFLSHSNFRSLSCPRQHLTTSIYLPDILYFPPFLRRPRSSSCFLGIMTPDLRIPEIRVSYLEVPSWSKLSKQPSLNLWFW